MKNFPDVNIVVSSTGVNGSGSHCLGYNSAVSIASGDILIYTHPEILFFSELTHIAHEALLNHPDSFISFPVCWMNEYSEGALEQYPWERPEELVLCHEIVLHEKNDLYLSVRPYVYDSTTTYAISRDTANRIGPYPLFKFWGPDDLWHSERRRRLGIGIVTIQDVFAVHQYHDSLKGDIVENGGWEEVIHMVLTQFDNQGEANEEDV